MYLMHNVRDMLNPDAPSDPPEGANDAAAGETLESWMSERRLKDQDMADLVSGAAPRRWDRTSIARVRAGKQKPSWDLIDAINRVTGGAVSPNSFFPPLADDDGGAAAAAVGG